MSRYAGLHSLSLAPAVSPALALVFSDLDTGLQSMSLERKPAGDGWSYKSGRHRLCGIDPKNTKGCLRVWVGEHDEQTAPGRLRGQFKQVGWLVVWPEDRALARDYILASVQRRIREADRSAGRPA